MGAMSEVRAAVFDAYGTLFDWASAAARAQDVLGDRWRPFAELWRPKQVVEPARPTDRDRWAEAVSRAKAWIPDLSALDF